MPQSVDASVYTVTLADLHLLVLFAMRHVTSRMRRTVCMRDRVLTAHGARIVGCQCGITYVDAKYFEEQVRLVLRLRMLGMQ